MTPSIVGTSGAPNSEQTQPADKSREYRLMGEGGDCQALHNRDHPPSCHIYLKLKELTKLLMDVM